MPRTMILAAVFLVGGASPFAQQPKTPTTITKQILLTDADNFLGFNNGLTIEELIEKKSNFDPVHNTYMLAYHPNDEAHRNAGGKATRDALLDFGEWTDNSDAVIIGTPTLRRSALTSSHKFVFSDYEVRIDEVLSDAANVLGKAKGIIVSRAGGETVVDGNNVRAIETEYPLFRLKEADVNPRKAEKEAKQQAFREDR